MHLIEAYQPLNEQEARDQALILQFLKRNPDALERTNLTAHLTSSAIITEKTMTKVLFAYHRIYDSWAWVGGHNDGDPDFLAVAIREALEETGLETVTPYKDDIFTLDVIYVPNHIKHGQYIPDHLHLNVTFLLIADENHPLSIKIDENTGVRWFLIEDALKASSEPRMKPVYQKAFDQIRRIRTQTKDL